jgi:hypothetical protein
MTADLKVVPISDEPSLAEIPAQLRKLADDIECGDRAVDAVFVVIPREQARPAILGFGQIAGAFDPIIQFDLARQWLVRAAAGLPNDE